MSTGRKWVWIALAVVVTLLPTVLFYQEIVSGLTIAVRWTADREQVEQFITGFGAYAPLVFMAFQVAQVIVAPVPGEATGFIGGYLFGATNGFIYSSVALAVGSLINFSIGRFLGRRFVRRWIPAPTLARFDHMVRHQGVIVLFILFVFPGFPKDYLCLFLGVTAIPLNVFMVIAAIGRMPGTLMLSLQGEFLFKQDYTVFAVVFGVTAVVILLSIYYREAIYRWIEKRNTKSPGSR